MLKQVEPLVQTPDQLLQALTFEMEATRAKRQDAQRRRLVVLAGGFLLILGGTTVALCALFSAVQSLPSRPSATTSAAISQR